MKKFKTYYFLFIGLFISHLQALNCFANPLGDSLSNLPMLNKTFAVVVHVVQAKPYLTNADTNDIKQDIQNLKYAFAPIGVRFEVSESIKIIPNFIYDTLNAERRTQIAEQYSLNNRINIFYCDTFPDKKGAIGLAPLGGVAKNGEYVIWAKKRTNPLAHEMGHYFGLYHTFQGSGSENVNGSNCSTEGDLVCDTPADPSSEDVNVTLIDSKCNFIGNEKDINGQYYMPDTHNIMSYYHCDCSKFTRGQYIRMVQTYLSNPNKW